MMELLKFEIKKILSLKSIYIAAAIFMFIYALYAYSILPGSLTNYRKAYNYYRPEEGIVTEQKISMARQGMKELNELYHRGIRFDDKQFGNYLLYRDINNVVLQKNNYMNTIKNLNSNSDIMKTLEKVGPLDSVYYTEGWKQILRFLNQIGYYFVFALVLLMVSYIFPQEQSQGMDSIINSTKEGRNKILLAKAGASIVLSVTAVLFFSLVNLLVVWYIFGLSGWKIPLKYIYYNTPYTMAIWKFYLLQLLLFCGCVSVIGLINLLISVISKNSIVSLVASGFIFIVLDSVSRAAGDNIPHGTVGFLAADFVRQKWVGADYLNIYKIFNASIRYEPLLFIVIVILTVTLAWSTFYSYRKINSN